MEEDFDPDKMLNKLENTTDDLRFTRNTILNKIIEKYKKLGQEEKAEKINP